MRYPTNRTEVPAYPAAAINPIIITPVSTNRLALLSMNGIDFTRGMMNLFRGCVASKASRRNPTDTAMGRTTACAFTLVARDEITLNITRPMTSSSIAAVAKIVPTRVFVKSVAKSTAYVVPSEVEARDAPAANAVSRPIGIHCDVIGISRKDKAIGNRTPVTATNIEYTYVSLSNFMSVVRPPETQNSSNRELPSYTSRISPTYPRFTIVPCMSRPNQEVTGPHMVPTSICPRRPHEKSLSIGHATICNANKKAERGRRTGNGVSLYGSASMTRASGALHLAHYSF